MTGVYHWKDHDHQGRIYSTKKKQEIEIVPFCFLFSIELDEDYGG